MKTTARQIVNRLVEDGDLDDPESVLQSQPGFEFRSTQFEGELVFISGPGEDTSDWPRPIGNVVEGPERRWYVIGVRGIPPEQLDDFGFGVRETPKLRTFDNRDEAALAIWLVWSRQTRKRREGYLMQ